MCKTTIIDGYAEMLDSLTTADKLDLISKLSASINSSNDSKRASSFIDAFGSFESNKSADELIDEIRNSRLFNREIASF